MLYMCKPSWMLHVCKNAFNRHVHDVCKVHMHRPGGGKLAMLWAKKGFHAKNTQAQQSACSMTVLRKLDNNWIWWIDDWVIKARARICWLGMMTVSAQWMMMTICTNYNVLYDYQIYCIRTHRPSSIFRLSNFYTSCPMMQSSQIAPLITLTNWYDKVMTIMQTCNKFT